MDTFYYKAFNTPYDFESVMEYDSCQVCNGLNHKNDNMTRLETNLEKTNIDFEGIF